ncbi:manganese efflux pump MntP family protein [Desulforudis sp. 1088]|uniref:manganese efflux pump MntP n=1 Tax=unclassified Candidatus Desulforudis TaxID=2635950 RepID=UPI003CE504CE
MSPLTLFLLAVALGTDAFSLSLGLALTGIGRKQALALVLVVLVFHIAFPVFGWWGGELLGTIAGRTAAYIGAAILIYLGLRMTIGTLRRHREEPVRINGVWSIIVLAASVSMDALSVGFTLGAIGAQLALAAGVIGMVAGTMTAAGLFLGRSIYRHVGSRAQFAGGLILLGVGVKLVF